MATPSNNTSALTGEVEHPQLVKRYFKTLQGLADYIRSFNITNGGFAYGDYPDIGTCFLLEYPFKVQS